ncbi:Uncharacterised protein [Vibrio cholerae]|nr:Uncharacterised protein [Vibrio cholerae]CSD29488.1 Uncharacterised protein [Vibrio cholerae]CSD32096.1 Uncharacterised protein [Vibrio cholerae]
MVGKHEQPFRGIRVVVIFQRLQIEAFSQSCRYCTHHTFDKEILIGDVGIALDIGRSTAFTLNLLDGGKAWFSTI